MPRSSPGVASGLPSTTSTVARMTASGVRSSWEALAMNRCWPSNPACSRAEHFVERLGQFAELVAGARRRDPRRQVVLGRGAGGRGDQVHRAQRPPGEDPAQDRGQGDDHGQRDQRVLQQVGQGEVTLGERALLLEGRALPPQIGGALGKDALVGIGA